MPTESNTTALKPRSKSVMTTQTVEIHNLTKYQLGLVSKALTAGTFKTEPPQTVATNSTCDFEMSPDLQGRIIGQAIYQANNTQGTMTWTYQSGDAPIFSGNIGAPFHINYSFDGSNNTVTFKWTQDSIR